MTIAAVTALVAGCAPSAPVFIGIDAASGREVTLRPSLPDRDFSGDYRSPHLGEIHLEQRGSTLVGQYHYEADGRRVTGSLQGRVRANLAEVEWEEHEVVGPDRSRIRGRGFFFYDAPTVSHTPAFDARPPARLFGRRAVATRILPSPPDEHYSWLDVSQRDEPWTAVQVVRAGSRP
jgi:hypothetical protein